jgi:hypothetical protein
MFTKLAFVANCGRTGRYGLRRRVVLSPTLFEGTARQDLTDGWFEPFVFAGFDRASTSSAYAGAPRHTVSTSAVAHERRLGGAARIGRRDVARR